MKVAKCWVLWTQAISPTNSLSYSPGHSSDHTALNHTAHRPTSPLESKAMQYLTPDYHATYHNESNGSLPGDRHSQSVPSSPRSVSRPYSEVVGSAESLVGRVLTEQGLGKYCDPEFVRTASREIAEALEMTYEEMDRAAHSILVEDQEDCSPPGQTQHQIATSPRHQGPAPPQSPPHRPHRTTRNNTNHHSPL